jgi:hypothetical protein
MSWEQVWMVLGVVAAADVVSAVALWMSLRRREWWP